MKFDYIIGNPPYQDETENTSDKPIYNIFMDKAFELGDIVELIHPARFLFNAGKTPKEWNRKMLKDEHFKVLDYWVDSSAVFSNVDIKGGVVITFRNANKNYGAIGVYCSYPELNSIISKVVSENFIPISNLIYSSDSHKFTEKLHMENSWVIDRLSNGHAYDVTTNIFEKIPELFYDVKPNDGNDYVGIYGLNGRERALKWIKGSYVKDHDNLYKYKVFVPKSNGSGALGEVLSTPVIGLPVIGHTQTFISIGKFETEKEAEACLKYVKTKFARTMLGVLKVTQHNPRDTWKYVPLQDFTENSDIDWSKSVAEIDRQLYAKYGLDEGEISFIESKVKEME